ncbi:MAG: FdhD protein [Euryarchaeota archaeon]|nr:FdhD protein [Euryarchaeota archaeon]
MIREYKCLRLDGTNTEEAPCQVVEEVPLSIFINGRHFVTAMISPQMRKEFVLGHLFAERIVCGQQEIESLEIEGNVARTIVAHPMRAIVPRRPIVSGCGGIATFLDESKLPEIKSDLRIGRQQAQQAMGAISLSETHIATGGVHSVGLFAEDGQICIIEDIGRHNALDKAIGYALHQKQNFDFSQTFVACTGRVSSDMALKCSVAGIPIVVSRGATTSLAISIAERTGLCIIGFLRGKRLSVYTCRERFAVD